MAGKTKSQKKKALDMRSKMYLVLALCSVMLLVSVGISLVLIGGIDLGGADAQSVSTVDSASMVVESGYNKEENTIDTQAYTSTILEQAADAGDSYVDETLFLGDSNTARMYRMFDYCSYDNAIGSRGRTRHKPPLVGHDRQEPGDLCLRAGKHFVRLHHDAPGRGEIAAAPGHPDLRHERPEPRL